MLLILIDHDDDDVELIDIANNNNNEYLGPNLAHSTHAIPNFQSLDSPKFQALRNDFLDRIDNDVPQQTFNICNEKTA